MVRGSLPGLDPAGDGRQRIAARRQVLCQKFRLVCDNIRILALYDMGDTAMC
jgi:hypothetical protein